MLDATAPRTMVQERQQQAVSVHGCDHIWVDLLDAVECGEDRIDLVFLLDHLVVNAGPWDGS